ncbi:MAG: hypothetical protein H6Q23_439 [Bacteroidetes bacterium]|nr:hypothetical protein [Bacteroidota bacterium]
MSYNILRNHHKEGDENRKTKNPEEVHLPDTLNT